MDNRNFVGRYLVTFFVLFGVWLAIVETLNWEEVITGLAVAALAAALGWRRFSQVGLSAPSPKKLLFLVLYIPVFFW